MKFELSRHSFEKFSDTKLKGKSVQWKPSSSMQTDRQTDRQIDRQTDRQTLTKSTAAFHKFEKASKNNLRRVPVLSNINALYVVLIYFLRSISILSSHQCLGLPSVLSLISFLYTFPSFHCLGYTLVAVFKYKTLLISHSLWFLTELTASSKTASSALAHSQGKLPG
jgi:hypothetical protein